MLTKRRIRNILSLHESPIQNILCSNQLLCFMLTVDVDVMTEPEHASQMKKYLFKYETTEPEDKCCVCSDP